jgi:hypothetical protein
MKTETVTNKGASPDTIARGHESGEIPFWPVLYTAIGIAVFAFLVASTARFFMPYTEVREGSRLKFLAETPFKLLPEYRGVKPLLQPNGADDLKAFRQEEASILNSYGWLDKQAGTVRIPIEQAMKIVVEKGLPVRGGSR